MISGFISWLFFINRIWVRQVCLYLLGDLKRMTVKTENQAKIIVGIWVAKITIVIWTAKSTFVILIAKITVAILAAKIVFLKPK